MESVCNMESECGECCECNECSERCESVTMDARVLRICCCDMLVCDLCSSQEYLVHTSDAGCFRVGECVRILYSGAATMSIPPQITARSIRKINGSRSLCCC